MASDTLVDVHRNQLEILKGRICNSVHIFRTRKKKLQSSRNWKLLHTSASDGDGYEVIIWISHSTAAGDYLPTTERKAFMYSCVGWTCTDWLALNPSVAAFSIPHEKSELTNHNQNQPNIQNYSWKFHFKFLNNQIANSQPADSQHTWLLKQQNKIPGKECSSKKDSSSCYQLCATIVGKK